MTFNTIYRNSMIQKPNNCCPYLGQFLIRFVRDTLSRTFVNNATLHCLVKYSCQKTGVPCTLKHRLSESWTRQGDDKWQAVTDAAGERHSNKPDRP